MQTSSVVQYVSISCHNTCGPSLVDTANHPAPQQRPHLHHRVSSLCWTHANTLSTQSRMVQRHRKGNFATRCATRNIVAPSSQKALPTAHLDYKVSSSEATDPREAAFRSQKLFPALAASSRTTALRPLLPEAAGCAALFLHYKVWGPQLSEAASRIPFALPSCQFCGHTSQKLFPALQWRYKVASSGVTAPSKCFAHYICTTTVSVDDHMLPCKARHWGFEV